MRTHLFILFLVFVFTGCVEKENFEAIVSMPAEVPVEMPSELPPPIDYTRAEPGDLIIISGGTVAATATPFPLHKIALFTKTGEFKRFLYETPSATEFLYGAAIDPITQDLVFTTENVDRLQRIDLATNTLLPDVNDANLNGTTMRDVAILADGSRLVAESATVIEKFSAAGVRAGAPFPITVPTAINSLRVISGDRFVVTFTTNPDQPRMYSAAGALIGTFANPPCTTSCDPFDVLELRDGRFVVSARATNALYLHAPNRSYLGVLYSNTSLMQGPSALAQLENGNVLACNTTFNTCEELALSGNTATRVGTKAFIDNASVMRQPMKVITVP